MKNMRKLQVIGAALVAMFAIGVLTAASASAVEFLLAEWLVGGAAVTSELTTETTGELTLEDTKAPLIGKAAVKCSGSFDGWVGPNSLDFVSEVLNLSGAAITDVLGTGTRLSCTSVTGCSGTASVNPLDLTWQTEVELMVDGTETFFADLFTRTGGGSFGWEVECTVLGTTQVDECTATEGVTKLLLNGSTLEGEFSEAFTKLAGAKLANCTLGGTESGVVSGKGPIKRGSETITASSETSEA